MLEPRFIFVQLLQPVITANISCQRCSQIRFVPKNQDPVTLAGVERFSKKVRPSRKGGINIQTNTPKVSLGHKEHKLFDCINLMVLFENSGLLLIQDTLFLSGYING